MPHYNLPWLLVYSCGILVMLEVGQAHSRLTQFFQETGRLPYSPEEWLRRSYSLHIYLVKFSISAAVSKEFILLFIVHNKHLDLHFWGARHTWSPSLWDHNKHNRVIALVNFRPRQCVLCWLLLWLQCPLAVSPPILFCQLPVLCRARGVDCVGCEPKPGWKSRTHKLTHTVHLSIVCQFHYFPTSVSEADGTCICVHPQLSSTQTPFKSC